MKVLITTILIILFTTNICLADNEYRDINTKVEKKNLGQPIHALIGGRYHILDF